MREEIETAISHDEIQRLRESEKRYRQIFAESLSGTFVATTGGKIVSCNPSFAHMLGFGTVEEALAGHPEVFTGEDEKADLLATLTTAGQIPVRFRKLRRNDGTGIKVLEKLTAVFDEHGRLAQIHGHLTDNGALEKIEEQQRHAQKMEAIGRLAGGVAHDFNNLLTVIKGYGELLSERLGAESPMQRPVEEIGRAAERAASLTRQLLAFSRQQVLQPEVLDLNPVLSGMNMLLSRLIGEHIELKLRLSPQAVCVKADRSQIEQAVLNLCVNARDAMPNGGQLTVSTEIVELDEAYARSHANMTPGKHVMLAVSDTGSGIDPALVPLVFEPFFTTKGVGAGSGLGLATVYGIVKQSGGYIWVYSEIGQGTTFKIYLPVAEGAPFRAGLGMRSELRGGTETILLVEDDERLRRLLATCLSAQGYRVLLATNGREAGKLLAESQEPVALVITDVVMPVQGGRELGENIRRSSPAMPILYMSGYTDDTVFQNGMLERGVAYLQKPFSPTSLGLKVRELLDSPTGFSATNAARHEGLQGSGRP